jgi:hypothetical protein
MLASLGFVVLAVLLLAAVLCLAASATLLEMERRHRGRGH